MDFLKGKKEEIVNKNEQEMINSYKEKGIYTATEEQQKKYYLLYEKTKQRGYLL